METNKGTENLVDLALVAWPLHSADIYDEKLWNVWSRCMQHALWGAHSLLQARYLFKVLQMKLIQTHVLWLYGCHCATDCLTEVNCFLSELLSLTWGQYRWSEGDLNRHVSQMFDISVVKWVILHLSDFFFYLSGVAIKPIVQYKCKITSNARLQALSMHN